MKTGAVIKSITFESSPDCCMDDNAIPEMTVNFVSNGAEYFVRVESASVFPIDGDNVLTLAKFINWVCKQNEIECADG